MRAFEDTDNHQHANDDKDNNATAQGSVAESNATGNPVNLLDGKL
ncbi:hypothetical protein ACUN9W_26160, partial [Escherichia coli]